MSKSIFALNILQTAELKKLMRDKRKKMFVDLNELRILKKCIDETSGLKNDSNFHMNEMESALVISFTDKNKGDLLIDVRKKKGYGNSNQTHIDVTSGLKGLSPALDFFGEMQIEEKKTFPILINSENIKKFGGRINEKNKWIEDFITVKRLKNRNKGKHPSIQLTEKNDIPMLRNLQDIGHSLIFIQTKTSNNINDFEVIRKNDENKQNKEYKEINSTKKVLSTIRSRKPVDPKLRVKIEKHGVNLSIKFLSEIGYEVDDVSKPELASKYGLKDNYPGYDQIALKKDKKYQIEVKSRMGKIDFVDISHNELTKGALNNINWRLLVVSEIKEENDVVHGGEITIFKISKKDLLSKFLKNIELTEDDLISYGLSLHPSYRIRLDSDFLSETILD